MAILAMASLLPVKIPSVCLNDLYHLFYFFDLGISVS